MQNPKYSADDIMKKGKEREVKKYKESHTSFDDAFNKIEESVEKKFNSIDGDVSLFKCVIFLKSKPVDKETLDKLQEVYDKAGFSIKQESKESLVDYTGPSSGRVKIPAEYETEYETEYEIHITFK